MNKQGPIIIIEDDAEDQMILSMVFKELNYPNAIIFFADGQKVLEYLNDEQVNPFIILSDINLPKLDGFKLRDMINTNDRISKKCIPYLFFSTAVDPKAVYHAYTCSVQGVFLKPTTYDHLTNIIKRIVEYWQECYSPEIHQLN